LLTIYIPQWDENKITFYIFTITKLKSHHKSTFDKYSSLKTKVISYFYVFAGFIIIRNSGD